MASSASTSAAPSLAGSSPASSIGSFHDRVLPPALQDRIIDEADALTPTNPFDVHSLNTSHLAPITRPAEIADILIALATPTTSCPHATATVPRRATDPQNQQP